MADNTNSGRDKFITSNDGGQQAPAPATPSTNLPGAGNNPLPAAADPANPNAPINPKPAPPQSGSFIDSDPNNNNLPTFTVDLNGKLITLTANTNLKGAMPIGQVNGESRLQTVQSALNEITTWYSNSSSRQKYINEMYAAGLITSKKSPSAEELARAWMLVVQESALQIQDPNGDIHLFSPDQVLAKAAQNGWNEAGFKQSPGDVQVFGNGNQNNSAETNSQSETIYKSYVDPATAAGTLADSYFRLMGRNPTQSEYDAFFKSLYAYQSEENTGKFEDIQKGPNPDNVAPSTGQPVDQSGTTTGGTSTITNTVSQRGIGMRGVQFLAGQQALASPEEGAYQAATTYFNAFVKALQGPAAGMEASGPTTTVP